MVVRLGAQELDDGAGHKYYFNGLTRTTTWTRPKVDVRAVEIPPLAVPGSEGLDPDWEEHVDDDGTAYFYNSKTRRTTWTRPTPIVIPGYGSPTSARV